MLQFLQMYCSFLPFLFTLFLCHQAFLAPPPPSTPLLHLSHLPISSSPSTSSNVLVNTRKQPAAAPFPFSNLWHHFQVFLCVYEPLHSRCIDAKSPAAHGSTPENRRNEHTVTSSHSQHDTVECLACCPHHVPFFFFHFFQTKVVLQKLEERRHWALSSICGQWSRKIASVFFSACLISRWRPGNTTRHRHIHTHKHTNAHADLWCLGDHRWLACNEGEEAHLHWVRSLPGEETGSHSSEVTFTIEAPMTRK